MLAKGPESGSKAHLAEHIEAIQNWLDKRGPLYAEFKYDGIRCPIIGNIPMTRKLKPVPNRYITRVLTHLDGALDGDDGEIITYNPDGTMKQFNPVQSDVMKETGEPDFILHVFDRWNAPGSFEDRLAQIPIEGAFARVVPVKCVLCKTWDDILAYEKKALDAEFEGLILRAPDRPYIFKRSSMKDFGMVKLKRWADSEAIIVGMDPMMTNTNELGKDERGFAKRSKAKAGLVPTEMMGKLHVIDIYHGWQFSIGGGPGMTAKLRAEFWRDREKHIGATIVNYKYFEPGMKDVPRFPGFRGIRDPRDMSP
jgi:DNA ligase-1